MHPIEIKVFIHSFHIYDICGSYFFLVIIYVTTDDFYKGDHWYCTHLTLDEWSQVTLYPLVVMSTGPLRRTVAIAVDSSDYSEQAFDCEYF